MGFLQKFKAAKDYLAKEFGAYTAETLPEKLPVFTEWFFTARIGQPRSIDITQIRNFAKSPWIQMVMNTIKKEISTIKWDIVPTDAESKKDFSKDIEFVKDFFENINEDGEDIADLMSMMVTDIGEIDANTTANVFSKGSYDVKEAPIIDDLGNINGSEKRLVLKPFGQRELLQVRPVDAATILKQIDVYRRLQAYYQYSFKNPRTNPIMFEPAEINYSFFNKKSYALYGFSPVQSIQQIIDLLIQSTRWNKDHFKNNAIPAGFAAFPGLSSKDTKIIRNKWYKEVKNNPHKLLFLTHDFKFQDMQKNAKDMEWLEGQKWYHWLVFAIFGVSPVEAGFHENVSKGNTEGQERVTVKNAIKPYLINGEKIANDIIKELLQQKKPEIMFKFFPKDHAHEKIEHEQNMQELDRGVITVNEIRKTRGLKPVEWGDEPMNKAPAPEEEDNSKPDNKPDEKKPPPKPPKKSISKSDSDIDMVEESEDYAEFLIGVMKAMEKKVLAALNHIPIEKSTSESIEKTFGEFLRDLMNSVNTLAFIGKIQVFVKSGVKAGIKSAELETGVDIGYTAIFSDKVKILTQQQLTGYTLPDGKAWHGIQGATRDLQVKILKSVQEDIINKESMNEMAENIQDIFHGSGWSQAIRIARTEKTRFINETKLVGYKESGVDGNKAYAAVMDDSTSDMCKRLHNKYFKKGIPYDEEFVDDVTGKSFMNPPSHCNCRCDLEFRKAKKTE